MAYKELQLTLDEWRDIANVQSVTRHWELSDDPTIGAEELQNMVKGWRLIITGNDFIYDLYAIVGYGAKARPWKFIRNKRGRMDMLNKRNLVAWATTRKKNSD